MDLHHLAAFEAIRTTKARYCRLLDQKKWAEFRTLFSAQVKLRFYDPDGLLQHEFTDLDQFVKLTANMLQAAQTIHQVHNSEIELTDATTALAVWSMEDYIIFPDGVTAPFQSMHGYGHYEEDLELVEGKWLIRGMTLRRTILNINQAGQTP